MRWIYSFVIRVYAGLIALAAFKSHKARLWRDGRKDWQTKCSEAMEGLSEVVWVHVASLGEFEQGRPLIEAIKREYPEQKIVLSFFSPSGYEIRKNYPLADRVFYLPIDTPFNAERWVSIIRPKVAVFVKYEFWFNMLRELHRRKVPTYFISVKFRPRQIYFSKIGGWFQKQLRTVKCFFVQDNTSLELLSKAGITAAELSGDTRYDRVMALLKADFRHEIIEMFKGEHPMVVVGSSWDKDEQLWKTYLSSEPSCKLLLVPHEIEKKRLDFIRQLFQDFRLDFISKIKQKTPDPEYLENLDVLVIDEIGYLSKVYRYADVAYIGGGFGSGIHNVLEAAVYGVPVIFGPKYEKFNEAVELVEEGLGFSVRHPASLAKVMDALRDKENYQTISCKIREFVKSRSQVVDSIMQKLRTEIS